MSGRVFIGPAGSEFLGDDVLRRPLFGDENGVHGGADISKLVTFELQPWQERVMNAQRRDGEERS